MSAIAATAVPVHRPPRDGLANLAVVTLFALRRNWVRLVLWFVVEVGMLAYIAALYKSQFSDQAALDEFLNIGTSPSMEALVGHLDHPTVLGAAVWLKGWMFLGLMLGIGLVFLVTRNLRADEEAGRIELLRSRPLGLHSELAATTLMTVALSLLVGLGSFAVLVGQGIEQPGAGVLGSATFGASITALGLLGVGLGLLANQIAPTGRGANALGSAAFGVFYLIRVIGDLQGNGLTWVSPIGWAEKMEPWGANRWWPLLLVVVLTGACAGAAWLLEARRDHGAGLVAPRPGKAGAARSLTTVAGLGFRLQRGGLIGWAIVLIICGALFGSVANQMTDLVSKISLQVFVSDSLDALISVFVAFLALIVAIAGVQSASHLRGDEAIGTLESQLAGRVTRPGWAVRRLAVSLATVAVLLLASGAVFGSVYGQSIGDSAQTGRVALAALAYLPASMVMISFVVLGLGWWPRLANSVAWALIGVMWFLVLFGPDLKLPSWVMKAIPFTGTPRLPAEAMSWPPVLIMAVVAVAIMAVGLVGFRRRDIPA